MVIRSKSKEDWNRFCFMLVGGWWRKWKLEKCGSAEMKYYIYIGLYFRLLLPPKTRPFPPYFRGLLPPKTRPFPPYFLSGMAR